MPAAAKPWFLNSHWNMSVMTVIAMMAVIVPVIVRMFDAFDVAPARHHEDMPLGAQHADVRPEQPRQHRRGDDFVDGAEHRLTVAKIEHAVERAEQLVELMRAE